MKRLIALSMLFLFACTLPTEQVKKEEEPPNIQPKDVLMQVMKNKDNPDDLHRLLHSLMQNGQIKYRRMTSKRFADGSTLTTEKWLLKDSGGNYHVIFIEQFILVAIVHVESDEKWEDVANPYGGWRNEKQTE